MKKITLWGVLAMLCLYATAQQKTIYPLTIGDSVPKELWNKPLRVVNHPEGKKTEALVVHKDKLLILDFWSTWCKTCVRLMPEIKKFENQFAGKVKFMLVTPQQWDVVAPFLKERGIKLTSIVEDKLLSTIFPTDYVPHEVWIKNGKVFAITESEFVTPANISGVIENTVKALPQKEYNSQYNSQELLLFENNGGTKNSVQYHSMITGYLPGINAQASFSNPEKGWYKTVSANLSPVQQYLRVAADIDPYFTFANRQIITLKRNAQLLQTKSTHPDQREDIYCYELLVPEKLHADAHKIMLRELNTFFSAKYGLRASVEKRNIKCWVLTKTKEEPVLLADSGQKGYDIKEEGNRCLFENVPFSVVFLSIAGSYKQIPLPLIDETGITANVNFEFYNNASDIQELNNALKSYGLLFTEQQREVSMFVITDDQTPLY